MGGTERIWHRTSGKDPSHSYRHRPIFMNMRRGRFYLPAPISIQLWNEDQPSCSWYAWPGHSSCVPDVPSRRTPFPMPRPPPLARWLPRSIPHYSLPPPPQRLPRLIPRKSLPQPIPLPSLPRHSFQEIRPPARRIQTVCQRSAATRPGVSISATNPTAPPSHAPRYARDRLTVVPATAAVSMEHAV